MAKVKIHQDVEGHKAGQEVDSATFDADRLEWYVGEGYVSTDASRGTDHGDKQTRVEDKYNPTDPKNASADTEPKVEDVTGTSANEAAPVETPEAYDPEDKTEAEVKQYLDQLPEGAGRNSEVRRIKALERKGQKRDAIVNYGK